MACTIWKYELQIVDEQILSLPKTAKILSAQNQGEKVVVWAMVDPNERVKKNVTFHIVGTGAPIYSPPDFATFLGTVQARGGSLVWHVFYAE